MTLELINPAGLSTPTSYSQVAIATGSHLVFVAGQVAVEVRASPAAGRRNKYWGAPGLISLEATWQEAWSEVDEIEVDRALLAHAGRCARRSRRSRPV
jgi:hypothetical protein